MPYFKVEAQNDELYLEASSLEEAKMHLKRVVGKKVLGEELTWTELEELPEGKIPLTFEDNVQRVDGNDTYGTVLGQ